MVGVVVVAVAVAVSCLHLIELESSLLPAILVFPSPSLSSSTLWMAIVVAEMSLVSRWFIFEQQ